MNCCPRYGFDMSDQMRRTNHCYHCTGCDSVRPRLEMRSVDPFELARQLKVAGSNRRVTIEIIDDERAR